MTAVLPPPDLRDRDGWHLFEVKESLIQAPYWWNAKAKKWSATTGSEWELNPFAETWDYVAPLFPAPDDDAAVERVAKTAAKTIFKGIGWGRIDDWHKDFVRSVVRPAIAAIRKGSDNG